MALFGKKEEKKEVAPTADVEKEKKSVGSEVKATATLPKDYSWVLKGTRITEKAAFLAGRKVYVFNIDPRATAKDVSKAIQEVYKVTPKKVNMAKVASKPRKSRRTRHVGHTSAGKKAYVYLQGKDTIEFV